MKLIGRISRVEPVNKEVKRITIRFVAVHDDKLDEPSVADGSMNFLVPVDFRVPDASTALEFHEPVVPAPAPKTNPD